jgi:recombination associated protein RdgC
MTSDQTCFFLSFHVIKLASVKSAFVTICFFERIFMGLISSTHAISRYHIDGKIDESVASHILKGLIQYGMPTIENEYDQISAGWVPVESPYTPDFEKFSYQFGTYFLFSLRVDKKSIPTKLIQKYMAIEIEKNKKKSGRDFISKTEKTKIKEHVTDILMHKIPAVPNIYDVLWNYEEKYVYFYSTQKAANELFETLFFKTFGLKAIRLFPYTIIQTHSDLSEEQKEAAQTLVPLSYSR